MVQCMWKVPVAVQQCHVSDEIMWIQVKLQSYMHLHFLISLMVESIIHKIEVTSTDTENPDTKCAPKCVLCA